MKSFIATVRRLLGLFLDNNCTIHAAGLTYYALLAVVPVLCCILVFAKMCGVDHYARTQINAQIDSLIVQIEKGQDDKLAGLTTNEKEREKKRIAAEEFAAQARRISDQLFERVEKFDVATVGWIGFGFLLWTIISSLGTVEVSFNLIWGVAKPRSIPRRACAYLFLLIALPILLTITMSMPILNAVKQVLMMTMGATWLTKWVSDGFIWILDSWMFRGVFTLFAATGAFTFLLWFLPNCRVPKRAAWIGGLFTAVTFGVWLKLCAVLQIGIAKTSMMYGSFAFLPIILAWLYISWQIILFGACLVRMVAGDEEAKTAA